MATGNIASSVPGINFLGTDDKSKRRPAGTPERMPFHRPLFFHFAEKGDIAQQYLPSSMVTEMYGDKFLDPKSKYFTHSSPFVQENLDAVGHGLHIRVLPEDCPNKSALAVSLNYALVDVDQYERKADGTYKVGADGMPVKSGSKAPGLRGSLVVTEMPVGDDGKTSAFGLRKEEASTLGADAIVSVNLPLFDVEATDFMDGTNIGFRLFGPTVLSAQPADADAMRAAGTYLYQFGIVERDTELQTPVKRRTYTYGNDLVPVSFGERVINADLNTVYDFDKVCPAQWNSTETTDIYRSPIGRVHVYRENIEKLTAKIHDLEKSYGTVNDGPAFVNLLGAMNVEGVPYYTFILDDLLDGGAEFTSANYHYLQGGGTGTMNNKTFNAAVYKILLDLDAAYHFGNYARFPFNAFWDSGFDHKTKMLVPSIIARRYDAWICLSTQDITEPANTPEQDASYATALLTRLQQFPDSDAFNTPAFRGIIHGQAAEWVGSTLPVVVPQSIDLFQKIAAWGSDSSGRANEENAPDAGSPDGDATNDNRVVRRTKNTTNVDVSTKTKKAEWAAGIVYVEDYDTRSYFYSGIQSFYTDATSVLRSGLVGLAVANINRYSWEAWRAYTGVQGITDDQLIQRTERYVANKCQANISTDRMVVVPHAEITASDDANGYSWTVRSDLYVSGMRTVLNASTVAYRRSDLQVGE